MMLNVKALFRLFFLLCLLSAVILASGRLRECDAHERETHPILCSHVDRVLSDPEGTSRDITAWAQSKGLLVDIRRTRSQVHLWL